MISGFQKKVYSLCKKIPKGNISTYGAIAKALGKTGMMSRAVGNALNKNPFGAWQRAGSKGCRKQACLAPCHRVVKSDGTIGGFATGTNKKIDLLRKEGIEIKQGKIIDFKKRLYKFK